MIADEIINEIRTRAEELLQFFQLADRRDDRVSPLSGGMKRRLTVARSLVNQPELVLLDEPTTGLDPQARHLLWERLYQLKRSGVTLLLTTHYMDEAERLCDRVAVIDHGKVIALGTPPELILRVGGEHVIDFAVDGDSELSLPEADLLALPSVQEQLEYVPSDLDKLLAKNDFGWAAANRDRILAEWSRRYEAKAEKK